MTDDPVRLSPREEEVVDLVIGRELSYRQAGHCLGISEHTVRSHAETIGRKLGGVPQKVMARYYWTVIQAEPDGGEAA